MASRHGTDERRQGDPLPSSRPPRRFALDRLERRCSLALPDVSGASAGVRLWRRDRRHDNATLVVALYVCRAFDRHSTWHCCRSASIAAFCSSSRYGLATETMGHWLKDHLKAALVGLLFAEIAAMFVYSRCARWPDYWWIIAAIGYSLVRSSWSISRRWCCCRCSTLQAAREGGAARTFDGARVQGGARIVGVYEWTLSDRTRKANAALAGMGTTRRILLSDTLLAEYSDDEIEVILAHELAHHVHKDIWTSLVCDMV